MQAQQEDIFCLGLGHATREGDFFMLLSVGEEPHVQQINHGHHFDGASFLVSNQFSSNKKTFVLNSQPVVRL